MFTQIEFVDEHISDEELLEAAKTLRRLKRGNRVLASILQYVIDAAADQYISEDYYHYEPKLLTFFKECGCDHEEVLFLHFINTHREALSCRNPECDSITLIGICPLLECPECKRTYFIDAGDLTKTICSRCAAYHDKTCTEERRRFAHRLFFVWEG